MARQTQQRQVIIDIFEKAARPLSPDEVHKISKSLALQPGIATIYRTINKLIEDGRLQAVNMPDEPATRYEMTGLGHHHHFLCRKCNKVFDIAHCHVKPEPMTPDGFKLESHEIWLFGLCNHCNKGK